MDKEDLENNSALFLFGAIFLSCGAGYYFDSSPLDCMVFGGLLLTESTINIVWDSKNG